MKKNKILISALFYLLIVVFVVVISLIPYIFDLEHANWNKVFANFIIQVILILITFSYQCVVSHTANVQDTTSEFNLAKAEFIASVKEIQNKSFTKLHELYVKDYNEKLIEEHINYLMHAYELDKLFLTCDKSVIFTAYKEKKITSKQFSIINKCRKKKFKLPFYNVKSLTCSVSLDSTKNTNKSQKTAITIQVLLSRVLWIFTCSFFLATFSFDTLTSGITMENISNMIIRLLAVASGVLTGYSCAQMLIKDDIRLYNNFSNFNIKCVQEIINKTWIPKQEDVKLSIVEEIINRNNKENTSEEIIEISEDDLKKINQKEV